MLQTAKFSCFQCIFMKIPIIAYNFAEKIRRRKTKTRGGRSKMGWYTRVEKADDLKEREEEAGGDGENDWQRSNRIWEEVAVYAGMETGDC